MNGEILMVIAMLAVGIVIAMAIGIPIAAAQRESGSNGPSAVPPDRNQIAASLLFNLLLSGGTPPDQALRGIRRTGLVAPVTSSIDMCNWAERFARVASAEQRAWLLAAAVQFVADRATPVPLRQYANLLDLTFGLGFQTDALAKLRQQYPFEYVDHAKDARPREADRAGGATPLFVRETRDAGELLGVLGIDGTPSRAAIIAAYRKLAAQHHPDRVFAEPAEVQSAAAARFIEITRAYEALLAIYRD
jgi:DnaJ domain